MTLRTYLGVGALASLIAFVIYWLSSPEAVQARRAANGVTIVERHEVSFSIITLERHQGLPMERMVIEGRRQSASDADVERGLSAVRAILDRKKPLIIHYDVREAGMVLSWHQLWMGVNWARDRANARLMDKHLQCISMTMRPGAVKFTIEAVVNILSPPQPVHIGLDDEGALRFAKARCRHRKDWSAESKKRQKQASRDADGRSDAAAANAARGGVLSSFGAGGLVSSLSARCSAIFSWASAAMGRS
jgi:hypothetical protein